MSRFQQCARRKGHFLAISESIIPIFTVNSNVFSVKFQNRKAVSIELHIINVESRGIRKDISAFLFSNERKVL